MEIEHQQDRQRFVARLDGGEAELAYTERDGRLDLQHTYVPREERGAGVGDALVRAAIRHARGSGERIVATCPFVAAWFEDHPEEREILASS